MRRFPTLSLLCVLLACQRSPAEPRKGAGDGLPGANAYDAELKAKLAAAVKAQGNDYVARTAHKRADGSPEFTNRLILETSPYLLQHAHNPVNWYPWGDEAFEAARRMGRPVFLSIGYSTCHWCHVMEEESFEDLEIAEYLNANYVAIKVDREERPDVDAIYMSAVQSMTGSGGWPMSVWLTPGRRPFYAGTYFPPRDGVRGATVGFLTVLRELRKAYRENPEQISEVTAKITRRIEQDLAASKSGDAPGAGVLRTAMATYSAQYDSAWGGLTRRHKFPSALPIRFLLRYHRRTGDPIARKMARVTLDKMAAGGMYDHVGGGFHRYSTDRKWLVPHFEKMLYDNALLVSVYLEGYQSLGDPSYARVAREILRYVSREMTSPEGGFYSATDADSLVPSGRREEGYFFTWTPAEIDEAVGASKAFLVKSYYGVMAGPNFEGRNILHTPTSLVDVAQQLGVDPDEALATIEQARAVLYELRKQRPPPLLDDKILTAWNGLMISAFAQAALVLDDPGYAEQAARAARFILATMHADDRLRRAYRAGTAKLDAYIQDYAFLIAGLLDLYEATGELRWLDEAVTLDAEARDHYEDREGGGYFATRHDAEKLLARQKPGYDGAVPSGNSYMALNLLRLHELTQKPAYFERADKLLAAFGATLERGPQALSEMLLALDYRLDLAKQIVIVSPGSRADAKPLLDALARAYVPNRMLAVVTGDGTTIAEKIPLVERKTPQQGKPTAYVCERGACELPTSDPEVFAKQIAKVRPLPEE